MTTLIRTVDPVIEPLLVHEVERHLQLTASNKEPVPSAPLVALVAPPNPGNVDNGAHRYRLTFVTADGETDGGDISDAVTVADKTINGRIAVTNIPVGGSWVTSRKLYRTKAGLNDFFLVATVGDNTTTTYEDNIADASLGVGCPSTNTTSDPDITDLIKSSRELAEEFLNKALLTQTWKQYEDVFPCDDVIVLRKPPIISVSSVKYLDDTGALVVFDAASYVVDLAHFPGRVVLKNGYTWPIALIQRNAVVVEFVAGYGATRDKVPTKYKNGMKLLISELYEHREAVTAESLQQIPAVERCFADRYKEIP